MAIDMYKTILDLNTDEEIQVLLTEEEIAALQSIPDPIPRPDWENFIEAMRPYFSIGLAANYAVFTQIFNMLLVLKSRRLDADIKNVEWQNFAFNFALGKSAFTLEQLAEIESAMILANIPLIETLG